jgi:hypothetical protein
MFNANHEVNIMSKATHTGTCQCCGAHQKLPNDMLAKHGYTTRHGFFEGTCFGSGHLPFEQSCDLIESMIERAEEKHEMLLEEINRWGFEENIVRRHEYIRGDYRRGSKSYWTWVEVEVLETEDGRYVYADRAENLRRDSYVDIRWDAEDKSKAAHVRYGNREWINHLRKQLANVEQYIEWQKERLENWAPAELTPIK